MNINTFINNSAKGLKLLRLTLAFLVGGMSLLQAQTTDASKVSLSKGQGDGVSVKLVDNKGTIKYLQTNNGITSITSMTAGSTTTTTWQLGGALTDSTYIDVSGKIFSLDGLKLIDPKQTGDENKSSTNAADGSTHNDATGTGWTLLIRDEATGALNKLLAEDLVTGIYNALSVGIDVLTGTTNINLIGLPVLDDHTTRAKLFVYRNGVKLREGVDFDAVAGKVTFDHDLQVPFYTDDVIEVQYIK